MASSIRGSGRGGPKDAGERQSVVKAMRAASRGRGGRLRSPTFEFNVASTTSSASLQKLFRQARSTGSLNLTSRGLEEVPEQVFHLLGENENPIQRPVIRVKKYTLQGSSQHSILYNTYYAPVPSSRKYSIFRNIISIERAEIRRILLQ